MPTGFDAAAAATPHADEPFIRRHHDGLSTSTQAAASAPKPASRSRKTVVAGPVAHRPAASRAGAETDGAVPAGLFCVSLLRPFIHDERKRTESPDPAVATAARPAIQTARFCGMIGDSAKASRDDRGLPPVSGSE
jgi:hypothetical protein